MSRDFDKDDASEQDEKRARKTAKLLRDVLRKTLSQGGDARDTTEDILRAVLGEVKIPREYVNLILQQVNTTRAELLRVVAGEVRTFLDDANLGEELAKILTSLSFEIRTEIRFVPNEDALKPRVKSRVGIKSARSNAASTKSAPEPEPAPEEEDDSFVEVRGTKAIDKAIQSRVAALANMFVKGIVDLDEEDDADPWAHDVDPAEDFNDENARSVSPDTPDGSASTQHSSASTREDAGRSDDMSHDEERADEDLDASQHSRGVRTRMSLGPDIRRRAEAAASQVATASRVTASLSAATAASAVSAAANRAQAVVRGSRNLTGADARDVMWKRWVSPEEPDLVGNPVIGAPMEYVRPITPIVQRPTDDQPEAAPSVAAEIAPDTTDETTAPNVDTVPNVDTAPNADTMDAPSSRTPAADTTETSSRSAKTNEKLSVKEDAVPARRQPTQAKTTPSTKARKKTSAAADKSTPKTAKTAAANPAPTSAQKKAAPKTKTASKPTPKASAAAKTGAKSPAKKTTKPRSTTAGATTAAAKTSAAKSSTAAKDADTSTTSKSTSSKAKPKTSTAKSAGASTSKAKAGGATLSKAKPKKTSTDASHTPNASDND